MFDLRFFPRLGRTRMPNRGRRGNSLIEASFTLLPTFAIIIAFVDFGLVLYRWSTLQNAVREGARYAVTFQTAAGFGQDASIRKIVEQHSMGLVKSSDNPQKIKVNYYSPSNLNTALSPGGNIPGNVVQVSVEGISWPWLAPLSGSFGSNIPMIRDNPAINLSVYSADILGGYPVGVASVPR
jgi:Flp pilus assembly protein TadG